jgi:uncharacterized membrane protein
MRVEETVDVAADPDAVWAVLVDVERWPTWTASTSAVRLLDPTPLALGSRVEVRQPRLPHAVWTVSALVPGRSFSWESTGPGVRSIGDHEITPTPAGCRVTLRFTQGGPLGGLVGVLMSGLIRRYVRTEAAGLKARCELP